jgi:hypothetical protein
VIFSKKIVDFKILRNYYKKLKFFIIPHPVAVAAVHAAVPMGVDGRAKI